MFTGIVRQLGEVVACVPADFGRSLEVDPRGWEHRPASGDSIAVNGCCLTVSGPGERGGLRFDVISQTLRTTTLGGLSEGDPVNLEPAVTPDTLLSGHLVQGHIDGVGTVSRVRADEDERRVRIEPPAGLGDVIVEKGSIAVDGVSLTVAALGDTWFEVALIPTTLEMTTLGRVKEGDRVNLEADCVAKTVVHWLKRNR